MYAIRISLSWALALGLVGALLGADAPAEFARPIDKGLQVWTTGHSFHSFVSPIVAELALSAGTKDHSALRGDPLISVKVDVVTCSPFMDTGKPDKALTDLTERGLKHNPNIRILAQVSWLASDDPKNHTPEKEKVDWNGRTIEDLRKIHATYFKSVDDQIRQLNKLHGKQVVFSVPVAQAVIALREKIVAGQAPGLKTQADLFRDARGHAHEPVQVLAGYCTFAVMYRRSPVGLPMSNWLKKARNPNWDEKLDHLLQELAWEAVTKEPLSGVKITP
jgi:hypothetical protein